LIAGIIYVGCISLLKRIIEADVIVEAIISVVLSGIIYLILLFLLKITSVKEIKTLLKRVF